MKHLLIGRSPLTTFAGYMLAILIVIRDLGSTGIHHWQDYLLPAAIALFGRLAGDDKHNRPPDSWPSQLPDWSDMRPAFTPVNFLRRGKEYKQRRNRNGQFASSAA